MLQSCMYYKSTGEIIQVLPEQHYEVDTSALPVGLTADTKEYYVFDPAQGAVVLRSLAEIKIAAKEKIDNAAGRARARYITSVPGQAETYQAKAADARAYKGAGSPVSAAGFPWMDAEAQARGVTPDEAASLVLQVEEQWKQIGAAVEAIRINKKLLVTDSASVDDVITVVTSAVADLDAV